MDRQRGRIEFVLLILVLLGASFLVGGLFKAKESVIKQTALINTANPASLCCDTGNGLNCKVQKGEGQTFTFNGQQYGLLKSNVYFEEAPYHLKDSGQKFNNNPIIINTSDGFRRTDGYQSIECINGSQDSIYKSKPPSNLTNLSQLAPYCLAIPNDELVYVCKKNCANIACPRYDPNGNPYDYSTLTGLYCYGATSSLYDVYFRVSDETNPGIPDPIKNCTIENTGTPLPTGSVTQRIVFNDTTKTENLQLKTFGVEQTVSTPSGTTAFLSPFCKPAVYLYPTEKTQVNVKIAPKGPVTLTIPKIPASGWDVTAYPGGKIESPDGTFPYLYYEAQIPDNLLTKERNGYVIEYKNLGNLFQTLLPKLGLNEKERAEFSDYWLQALPSSPFYFVGVVNTQTLDSVSPLNISPKPQTIIRVGLYFEPLTEKIAVNEPKFFNTTRKGFTVVEWGGLFKKEKNSNFTCIM